MDAGSFKTKLRIASNNLTSIHLLLISAAAEEVPPPPGSSSATWKFLLQQEVPPPPAGRVPNWTIVPAELMLDQLLVDVKLF